jgi:hypothetical protein
MYHTEIRYDWMETKKRPIIISEYKFQNHAIFEILLIQFDLMW